MREVRKMVEAVIVGFNELDYRQEEVLYRAVEARRKAQAPYSHYFVGAAVRSESGKVYIGCNVERASYTQTTHAEQNAIDSMVAAEGPTKVTHIAIVGGPENQEITLPPKTVLSGGTQSVKEVPVPCGHCLQIIWENCFGDGDVEIISLCRYGEVAVTTIDNALPMKFGPTDLGVNY